MTPNPLPRPWDPPELEVREVMAIKSLYANNANAEQQKVALWTIMTKFCQIDDMSFSPGGLEGARASDFAEGKRRVGTLIRAAINRPMPTQITGAPDGTKPDPIAQSRRNPKPESERAGKPKS